MHSQKTQKKVFGFDKEISYIKQAISLQDVACSFLLTGPEMIGKRTLAAVLALEHTGSGYIQLVSVLEGETSISIDQIRAVRHWLKIAAPSGVRRFIIIDNAHLMTTEAQNAFLKTLEEPPTGTCCFLVSHNSGALLPTIRSRVVSMHLRPVDHEATQEFIKQFQISDQQKKYLLQIAAGKPGLIQRIIEHPEQFKKIVSAWNDFAKACHGERLLMIHNIIETTDPNLLLVCWLAITGVAGRTNASEVRRATCIDAAFRSLQLPGTSPKIAFERLALSL